MEKNKGEISDLKRINQKMLERVRSLEEYERMAEILVLESANMKVSEVAVASLQSQLQVATAQLANEQASSCSTAATSAKLSEEVAILRKQLDDAKFIVAEKTELIAERTRELEKHANLERASTEDVMKLRSLNQKLLERIQILQKESMELRASAENVASLQAELNTATAKLSQVQRDASIAAETNGKLSIEVARLKRELTSTQDIVAAKTILVEDMTLELERQASREKTSIDDVAKLRTLNSTILERVHALQNESAELKLSTEKVATLQVQLEATTAELEREHETVANAVAINDKLSKEIANLKQKLEDANFSVAIQTETVAQKTRELEEQAQREKASAEDVVRLRRLNQKVIERVQSLQKECTELKASANKVDTLQAKLDAAGTELLQERAKLSSTAVENRELVAKVASLKKELGIAQDRLAKETALVRIKA